MLVYLPVVLLAADLVFPAVLGPSLALNCQDVRKAQSLGFALDDGISIVEADVTKGPT